MKLVHPYLYVPHLYVPHLYHLRDLLTATKSSYYISYLNNFRNRSFLYHHVQRYDRHPLIKSYIAEEEKFLKYVKIFPLFEDPKNADIVGTNVVYKLKMGNDNLLKLKARFSPHRNQDSIKHELYSTR